MTPSRTKRLKAQTIHSFLTPSRKVNNVEALECDNVGILKSMNEEEDSTMDEIEKPIVTEWSDERD